MNDDFDALLDVWPWNDPTRLITFDGETLANYCPTTAANRFPQQVYDRFPAILQAAAQDWGLW